MTTATIARVGLAVEPRLFGDGLARILTSLGLDVVDVGTGDERVAVLIVTGAPPAATSARLVIAVRADGSAAAVTRPDGTVVREVVGLEEILEAVLQGIRAHPHS